MRIVREPIGMRLLLRALRPEDREPFLIWRADPWPEAEALIEAGQRDDRAYLWASLLRWSEAQMIAELLVQEGWEITLLEIRALALARLADQLEPPRSDEGWLVDGGTVAARAVAETPGEDDAWFARLLSFLDGSSVA